MGFLRCSTQCGLLFLLLLLSETGEPQLLTAFAAAPWESVGRNLILSGIYTLHVGWAEGKGAYSAPAAEVGITPGLTLSQELRATLVGWNVNGTRWEARYDESLDPMDRFALKGEGPGWQLAAGRIQLVKSGTEESPTLLPSPVGALGLSAQVQAGRWQGFAYAGTAAARTAVDLLQGEDRTGPYRLRHRPVVEGSEQVAVDGRRLVRGVDYQIDWERGDVQFTLPIPSYSQIRVEYLYADEDKLLLTGVGLSLPLDLPLGWLTGVRVGLTYAAERPVAPKEGDDRDADGSGAEAGDAGEWWALGAEASVGQWAHLEGQWAVVRALGGAGASGQGYALRLRSVAPSGLLNSTNGTWLQATYVMREPEFVAGRVGRVTYPGIRHYSAVDGGWRISTWAALSGRKSRSEVQSGVTDEAEVALHLGVPQANGVPFSVGIRGQTLPLQRTILFADGRGRLGPVAVTVGGERAESGSTYRLNLACGECGTVQAGVAVERKVSATGDALTMARFSTSAGGSSPRQGAQAVGFLEQAPAALMVWQIWEEKPGVKRTLSNGWNVSWRGSAQKDGPAFLWKGERYAGRSASDMHPALTESVKQEAHLSWPAGSRIRLDVGFQERERSGETADQSGRSYSAGMDILSGAGGWVWRPELRSFNPVAQSSRSVWTLSNQWAKNVGAIQPSLLYALDSSAEAAPWATRHRLQATLGVVHPNGFSLDLVAAGAYTAAWTAPGVGSEEARPAWTGLLQVKGSLLTSGLLFVADARVQGGLVTLWADAADGNGAGDETEETRLSGAGYSFIVSAEGAVSKDLSLKVSYAAASLWQTDELAGEAPSGGMEGSIGVGAVQGVKVSLTRHF